MEVKQAIKQTMAQAQQWGYEKMFPFEVQRYIGIAMDVSTVRRYMAQMAREGEIQRLGQRKGYALAH